MAAVLPDISDKFPHFTAPAKEMVLTMLKELLDATQRVETKEGPAATVPFVKERLQSYITMVKLCAP
jgi:hypothetical protein